MTTFGSTIQHRKAFTLFSLVLTSLFFQSLFVSAALASTVIGSVDGAYSDGAGGAWVAGWACAVGDVNAITVKAYAGSDTPSGEFIGGMVSNQASEAAVNTACQSTGSHYRYGVHLTAVQLAQFAGELTYVQGVDPATGLGVQIGGSGLHALPAASAVSSCSVSSLTTLASCFANISKYQEISFTTDVTCTGTTCCAAGNTALMNLSGQSYKVINGNGHALHRLLNPTTGIGYESRCPALQMTNSNYIKVSSLSIDDDERVPSCTISGGNFLSNCASTVVMTGSKSVDFENFGVYEGKGYVFNVSTSTGVVLNQSVVADAGIIGIIAGTNSQNIFVRNSVIARSVANGIALTGVSGTAFGANSIDNNIFSANHRRGAWPAGNGVMITGGQVYPQTANYLDVHDNVIADGACSSCGSPANAWAFEIGGASGSTPSSTTGNMEIWNNYIYNGSGLIYQMDYNSQFSGQNVLGGAVTSSEPADVIEGFTGAVGNFPDRSYLATFSLTDAYWGSYVYPVVAASARLAVNDVVSNSDATLVRGGFSDYTIYRLSLPSTGYHREADSANEGGLLATGQANLDATFGLSPSPRVGAPSKPIYRCYLNGIAEYDFASLDPNCGTDARSFHSILGYSYESTHPGALPFYSCLNTGRTDDYFVSWSSTCEGQQVIAKLGYAVIYRYLMPMATYTQGVTIEADFPNTRAIPGLTYSISPALPAGLVLNTSTGVISGTPTAYSPLTAYTVKTAGRFVASIPISIGIRAALAYSKPNVPYVIGQKLDAVLTAASHASLFTLGFQVSPALPAGLTLNAVTGEISGTPTTALSSGIYTVTAIDPQGHASSTQVIFNSTPIYELLNGADQLLSPQSNEGETSGFVPFSEQFEIASISTGIDATPIYRCISGQGHFLSNGSNCEGQTFDKLLGYISTSNQGGMLALNRYSNSLGVLVSLTSSTPVPSGFTLQGRLGYVWPSARSVISARPIYQIINGSDQFLTSVYSASAPVEFSLATTAATGRAPIYSCTFSDGHFLSPSSTCEGQTVLGLLGYVSSTNTGGLLTLYRYVNATGNHFEGTSSTAPAGYHLEAKLGYVW